MLPTPETGTDILLLLIASKVVGVLENSKFAWPGKAKTENLSVNNIVESGKFSPDRSESNQESMILPVPVKDVPKFVAVKPILLGPKFVIEL